MGLPRPVRTPSSAALLDPFRRSTSASAVRVPPPAHPAAVGRSIGILKLVHDLGQPAAAAFASVRGGGSGAIAPSPLLPPTTGAVPPCQHRSSNNVSDYPADKTKRTKE